MSVRKATYGANDTREDVTGKVQAQFNAGNGTWNCDGDLNGLFGDPIFGVVKTVDFELSDGSTYSYSEGSNFSVSLPKEQSRGGGGGGGGRMPGLFGCLRKPIICCNVMCCSTCMVGRQCAAINGERNSLSVLHCIGSCLGAYSICVCCIRMKVNEKYGLNESCCISACVAWICPCCSMIQTQKVLKRNGMKPGLMIKPPSIKGLSGPDLDAFTEKRKNRRDERRKRNEERRNRRSQKGGDGTSSSSDSSDSD